jgi:hypothetical protein
MNEGGFRDIRVRPDMAQEQHVDEVTVPVGGEHPCCASGEPVGGGEHTARHVGQIDLVQQQAEGLVSGDPRQHLKGTAPDLR